MSASYASTCQPLGGRAIGGVGLLVGAVGAPVGLQPADDLDEGDLRGGHLGGVGLVVELDPHARVVRGLDHAAQLAGRDLARGGEGHERALLAVGVDQVADAGVRLRVPDRLARPVRAPVARAAQQRSQLADIESRQPVIDLRVLEVAQRLRGVRPLLVVDRVGPGVAGEHADHGPIARGALERHHAQGKRRGEPRGSRPNLGIASRLDRRFDGFAITHRPTLTAGAGLRNR